jgi:hypothetical protein
MIKQRKMVSHDLNNNQIFKELLFFKKNYLIIEDLPSFSFDDNFLFLGWITRRVRSDDVV